MIPANPNEWGREFARLLLEAYGLEPSDTYYQSLKQWKMAFYAGESPQDIVDHIGSKYRLTIKAEFTLEEAEKTIGRFEQ